MRVRESHDFHGGYVAQRLKLYASMTAQDLLRLYSKSQVGRGWDAPIQQPFPCEARPGPASPAVMSDHHRRVSSSKHPSPSTIPVQSATVAESNDLMLRVVPTQIPRLSSLPQSCPDLSAPRSVEGDFLLGSRDPLPFLWSAFRLNPESRSAGLPWRWRRQWPALASCRKQPYV